MSPNKTRIIPETVLHTLGGILINAVLNFKARVKITIAKAKEAVITYGLRLTPLTEPPMMIGSSGKTHGANTVRMPATKETTSKNIVVI
jgi:hypothetical protein